MRDKVNFFISKIYYLILIIVCIIMIFLLHQSINIGFMGINNDYLIPIILVIISIVYIKLIFKFSNKVLSKNNINYDKLAIILTILSFAVMLILSHIIQALPKNDLATVIAEAKNLEHTNTISDIHYFSRYPNNLGILYIVAYIYRLANFLHINGFSLAYIFSALSVSLSFYFTYLSIKKVGGNKSALVLLIYLIFNPVFYLYVTYYYNDVFALLLISLLSYLIIITKDEEINKKRIINYILIGLLSYIGFKIRAVVIFVLIAFYLISCFTKKTSYILKMTLLIVIGFSIGYLVNFGVSNSFDFTINKEETNSFTHFIMMGLNQKYNGKWNSDDYLISYRAENAADRKQKNIDEIKNRLNDMNAREKYELFYNKYKITWGYGDCSFHTYYNLVNNINRSYDYIVGNKTIILNYILQSNRIVLYVFALFSIIYELINKNRNYNFIIITLFGAFLFYTFWEAFPRYSLSFLPIFVILIGYNYEKIINFELKKILKINKEKAYKYLKLLIIFITVCCYLINYSYYTKDLILTSKKAVFTNIDSLDNRIYIKSDDTIKQSFSTNLSFNSIKIKVHKKENKNNNVELKLYNDKNELLYKGNNVVNNIGDSEVEFKLDKTYNTKKKEYYIEITTNEKNNWKIAIVSIHRDNTDHLPSGVLYVNDKKDIDDLKLDISNVSERPRLSKRVYILVAISSILIELYAFDVIDMQKIKKLIGRNN